MAPPGECARTQANVGECGHGGALESQVVGDLAALASRQAPIAGRGDDEGVVFESLAARVEGKPGRRKSVGKAAIASKGMAEAPQHVGGRRHQPRRRLVLRYRRSFDIGLQMCRLPVAIRDKAAIVGAEEVGRRHLHTAQIGD